MNLDKFFKTFPNEKACLNYFKRLRYPDGIYCAKCKMTTKFTKIKNRPVYECSCGFQVSILANTIFSKTHLPLQYWFYCIFVMSHTRSGVSAKQIQRELGISYPAAWRMMKQIRSVMVFDDEELLDGVVEIDETYVGGRGRASKWKGGVEDKQVVFGMVERHGRAKLKHVPDSSRLTLIAHIQESIAPDAHIMSDQYAAYTYLPKLGYKHDVIVHQKEYVRGNVYTQTIEGVWSHLKKGIFGVYRHVSPKYLQLYADEFAWRYSNRNSSANMFFLLMERTVLQHA